MHTNKLLKNIYHMNLSWFFLAQQQIDQDKASAMYRLGINDEIAIKLCELSHSQTIKLAKINQLVFQLRFADHYATMDFAKSPRINAPQQLSARTNLTCKEINKSAK